MSFNIGMLVIDDDRGLFDGYGQIMAIIWPASEKSIADLALEPQFSGRVTSYGEGR